MVIVKEEEEEEEAEVAVKVVVVVEEEEIIRTISVRVLDSKSKRKKSPSHDMTACTLKHLENDLFLIILN